MEMTEVQKAIVTALSKKGYHVSTTDEDTVYMTKRVKTASYYAEVSPCGLVNGKPFAQFEA